MELISNPLDELGVKLLKPRVFEDERGYFFESFNDQVFGKLVGSIHFCQDNQSSSAQNVVRGLHYQLEPRAQTKLVRVVQGRIWDVAVDLRKSSGGFGKWFGVELSAENKLQLLVPKGFAHGFVALERDTVVAYKVDELYSKDHDRGVRFDDPELNIQWPLSTAAILSAKDQALPSLQKAELFK